MVKLYRKYQWTVLPIVISPPTLPKLQVAASKTDCSIKRKKIALLSKNFLFSY